MIHTQAADAPAKAVAQWNRLDDETVKAIDQEILEHQIAQAPKSCATFLGVDEIAHRKGHHYLTLITDLEARHAIGLVEGREANSLGQFFRYLGREHCRCIRAVTVDRWQPYRKAIRAWCPQALVIFDKFHIIGDCNEAVDKVRRRLQSGLGKEARLALKHCRWAVLKNPENLTPGQHEKLRGVERYNRPLYRAYLLKEEFRQFYAMEPAPGQSLPDFLQHVERTFAAWCRRVMYSRIPELKHFVRNLRKSKQMVFNYFIHRRTNGLTEGLNSVIRSIQRRACGYRDMAYFTLKVYQKAGVIR